MVYSAMRCEKGGERNKELSLSSHHMSAHVVSDKLAARSEKEASGAGGGERIK